MAKRQAEYDYGDCHVCGELLEPRLIKQEFWIKGKLVVVEAVPAGVCPSCGEKVVTADVGGAVASLVTDPKRRRAARTISVPVIRFGKTAKAA